MKTRPEPYKDKDTKDRDGEVWIDAVGFDGMYSVSNHGRVKSEHRYNGRGHLIREKILSQTASSKYGVLTVKFSVDGIHYTRNVMTLVGECFIGEKKEGEVYCHKNKIKTDNRSINIMKTTWSGSSMIDYQLGVKMDWGIGDFKSQERKLNDDTFNIYEDGILVSKICNKCLCELPISEFQFRNDINDYRRECTTCRLKARGISDIGKLRNRIELAYRGLRYCHRCKELKKLDTDFYNNRAAFLGKSNTCIKCQNTLAREKYHSVI